MSVSDLIDSQKGLSAGFLAMAMIPSATGVLHRDERAIEMWRDQEPSGSCHPLKYWNGFTPWSSFRDRAVPKVLCGSGGDSAVVRMLDVGDDFESVENEQFATLSQSDIIASIRASLSLQVKELAEILGVQRPTIYSWINDESQPSAKNRDLLQRVYRIAATWNRFCRLPADHLIRAVGADGKSVLDLLKADVISESEILSRFKRLSRDRMKLQSEADKHRPVSDALAQKHGLNLSHVSDQQNLIDALTGKRSQPE